MEDTGRWWESAGGVSWYRVVTLAWAVWTPKMNVEVTAGAQGRRATCLPSSLVTHPLSCNMTFSRPSTGEPPVKALLSTPSHKILSPSDLYCSFINYSSWTCPSRTTGFIDVACPSGKVLTVMKDRKWKWGWKVYFTRKDELLHGKPFAKWSNFILSYVIWGLSVKNRSYFN